MLRIPPIAGIVAILLLGALGAPAAAKIVSVGATGALPSYTLKCWQGGRVVLSERGLAVVALSAGDWQFRRHDGRRLVIDSTANLCIVEQE